MQPRAAPYAALPYYLNMLLTTTKIPLTGAHNVINYQAKVKKV